MMIMKLRMAFDDKDNDEHENENENTDDYVDDNEDNHHLRVYSILSPGSPERMTMMMSMIMIIRIMMMTIMILRIIITLEYTQSCRQAPPRGTLEAKASQTPLSLV